MRCQVVTSSFLQDVGEAGTFLPAKSWASSPGMMGWGGHSVALKRKRGCRSTSGSTAGEPQLSPLAQHPLFLWGWNQEPCCAGLDCSAGFSCSVHYPDTALCLISWRLVQHGLELCWCQQDVPRGARPCQGVCISLGLPLLSTARDGRS